jgi:hypothetical protein
LTGGLWLVLVCFERRVLLVGCWGLVCCERKVLLADKPSEQVEGNIKIAQKKKEGGGGGGRLELN